MSEIAGNAADAAERERVRARRERVVELTRRLVRIPSVSPPGDTREPCEAVAEVLSAVGFAVDFVEETPGFVNLVAEHDFARPGPTLLFNGHLDVVPLGGADRWTRNPWGGEVVDGRLHGRGSLDMKGPLAAVLVAVEEALAAPQALCGRLVVSAVADEEQGGEHGTGALVRSGVLDADAAVVVEPGDGGVVTAHRGLCFVKLTTHGRSAHASRPAEGVNAVELMVDALNAMRSLQLSHTPHPALGGPSVVPGTMIEGGHKANVIPDTCTAMMDVRAVPGMRPETVAAEVVAHAASCGLTAEQLTVEIDRWGEPGETAADARIVEVCAAAFAREFGSRPAVRSMSAYTDGGRIAKVGIPTVMAFGPGSLGECHIVDESVDVEELTSYAAVYRGVIESFLAAP